MRTRMSILLGVALLIGVGASRAGAADGASWAVRYVTADRVYVDGGERSGLAVGDRLEVRRGGSVSAVLEVVYVATHSASCRVVESSIDPAPGDEVRFEGEAAVVLGQPRVRLASRSSEPSPSAAAPAPRQTTPRTPRYPSRDGEERALRPSLSGSLTFDWEQFTDDSELGRDFDRTSARLSLRGRNLGGTPLQLRIRTSTRTLDRVVSSDGSSSVSDTRDRLYELSLAYEPPEGRFALRLGRLRLGRYAGAGTVDGVSAETRLGRVFRLGIFGGSRSDISDLGYDGDRTTYGVTTRWTAGEAGGVKELLVAAVREDGVEDVSREYVAVQSRVAAGRLSFYQRAEFDLNNGWREELAGTTSQLSTLFVNASVRASDFHRFSISYSRFERYRTEETRFIPEELFDENLRQGLRARWTIGRSRGLNATLSAGLRERDGDDDDATSAGLAMNHNNLFGKGFGIGVRVLAFSNRYSDGTTVTLRTSKRFKGGHRLSLTGGARTLDDLLRGSETRETQWLRLGGWFELPGNLFGRAEIEGSTGDEIEGQRILVGLGYRL